MQNELCSDLAFEYKRLFEEKKDLSFFYIHEYLKNVFIFPNSKDKRRMLSSEYRRYLKSFNNYKSFLNFLSSNEEIINYKDAKGSLKLLNDFYKKIIVYMFELVESFQSSTDSRLDYRFYITPNKPDFLNDYYLNEILCYAKGFNLDRISSFLNNENVMDYTTFNKVIDEAKIYDCSEDNYTLYAGVNQDGRLMMPLIKDDKSALINVHEIVHKALLLKKDLIKDDKIVRGEYLPRFYELVYKDSNEFCNANVHEDLISLELFSIYNGEPLEVQVKKLQRILRG